jgi:hypothetical protein
MEIGFNKYQVYGKIVILTFIISFIGLFIYFHPPLKFDNSPPTIVVIMLPLIGGLIFFMSILMTLQLVFLPKSVIINTKEKSLTIKFFFARQFSIQINEINEFSTVTVIAGKVPTTYNGLMLHLENGKDYLLGDFNLETFLPIQTFLQDTNVPFVGHEKFSFVQYFINYFKP